MIGLSSVKSVIKKVIDKSNAHHSISPHERSFCRINKDGFIIQIIYHAGLCPLGLKHMPDLRIIYRNLRRIFGTAVACSQHRSFFHCFFCGLFAVCYQNRVRTGNVLGMEPNIIVIGVLHSQLIVLTVISAYKHRTAPGPAPQQTGCASPVWLLLPAFSGQLPAVRAGGSGNRHSAAWCSLLCM